MQRLLLIVSLFSSLYCSAQQGYLFIKKNGKKVRSYPEGSFITMQTNDGVISGHITLLRRDSVFINGRGLHYSEIKKIILPKAMEHLNFKNFLYTTAGAGLTTLGMSVSKVETFGRALSYSLVIGYTPWAWGFLRKTLTKKKYKLGKKFKLQVFDLRPF